jgi:hypothetical protein
VRIAMSRTNKARCYWCGRPFNDDMVELRMRGVWRKLHKDCRDRYVNSKKIINTLARRTKVR